MHPASSALILLLLPFLGHCYLQTEEAPYTVILMFIVDGRAYVVCTMYISYMCASHFSDDYNDSDIDCNHDRGVMD